MDAPDKKKSCQIQKAMTTLTQNDFDATCQRRLALGVTKRHVCDGVSGLR